MSNARGARLLIQVAAAVIATTLSPLAWPGTGSATALRPEAASTATSSTQTWLCGRTVDSLPWLRSETSNPYAASVVQKILNSLGYNSGPVDGVYGSVTQNAVKRFQAARGIAVDGKVGPQTWGSLQAVTCPAESSVPTSAEEYTVQENRAWSLISTSTSSATYARATGKSHTVGLVRWVCNQLDSDYTWDDVAAVWQATGRKVQQQSGTAEMKRWLQFGAFTSVAAVREVCPWHLSDPDVPF